MSPEVCKLDMHRALHYEDVYNILYMNLIAFLPIYIFAYVLHTQYCTWCNLLHSCSRHWSTATALRMAHSNPV